MRNDGRKNDELRKIKFTHNFTKHALGSVLAEFGVTKVIVTASVDLNGDETDNPFWDYYEECRRRGCVKRWTGKIIKGNGTFERLRSHDEILKEYGVSERLRDVYFRFLRNCYLNGHLISNDKLERIIVCLDERYGNDPDSDEPKIAELEKAISGGYFDVRHW